MFQSALHREALAIRAPSSSNTAVLPKMEVRKLTAHFGTTRILEGATLDLVRGEVTAIIGPSGCGKSTFLRCLNRMHEVTPGARVDGTVLLDGTDIYDRRVDPAAVRRRIGMVFQRANPFPTMSIRQNILAGFTLSGQRPHNPDDLVESALSRAALWDEVKDRLSASALGLSGGQQQRLCIARALALSPEVLLMDEPCSALDPIATEKVEHLITSLAGSVTVVVVTHNMQQALRVSHATAFFYLGELVEHGMTETLFRSPRDARTADYLSGRFG